MRSRRFLLVLSFLGSVLAASGLSAPSRAAGAGVLCRSATDLAEHESGVPNQLLTAISRVETGQPDPDTGKREAWPWSINVEGTGHVYGSKEEAIAAVRQYQSAGARSIDVGCMQINLLQHPDAFSSLEQAFDPAANARYGARFLLQLFGQLGSWPHAVAAYHSQTPGLGESYQWQVLQAWADGDGPVARHMHDNHGAGGGSLFASSANKAAAPTTVASAGATAPFGNSLSTSIQHYGSAVSRLPPGKNRDLSAYRTIPIAMNTARFVPTRF